MSTRNLAWGATGGVSLLLAMACSGTNIHDVGNADDGGNAGRGGKSGVGGTRPTDAGTGSSDVGGTGLDYGGNGPCPGEFGCAGTGNIETGGTGSGGCFGTFSCAGTGNVETGGTGTAGFGPAGCFDPPSSSFGEAEPALAPQNRVFLDSHFVSPETVKNSADQQLFPSLAPVSEAYANFSASSAAANTSILLPAQLSEVAANVGQLYVPRSNCVGLPAAGHALTVEFWWKHGVVAELPTHGVALGAVSKNGKAVWFEDSARTFVKGDATTKRLTNTLNRQVVEHTFADDDKTDAGQVTIGIWLLPDDEFASTFYIGKVKWD